MPETTKIQVARSVSIALEQYGKPIIETPVPTDRFKVASFVEKAFPGQQIEHLGRTEFVKTGYGKEVRSPSSLFFQAVHLAYAEHHALGLRPEVLMYLINAVVAETIRRNPDDYRDLFTVQVGKIDIHIDHNNLQLDNPDSPWDEAIAKFDQALRPHVPSEIMGQMLPRFTTSNNEAQVASLVAFMDAASPYYDYHTHTMCGIPRVVLFGEPADYRRLVIAATELSVLFTKHLAPYFTHLIPVLETIARTAETGEVDRDFWRSIYKHEDMSGTDLFGGWVSAFLWYVHWFDWETKTNPLVVKGEKYIDWRRGKLGFGNGLASGSQPSHISRVPFTWHYLDTVLPMYFIGGILGIEVVEGALTPELSYGVLRAS